MRRALTLAAVLIATLVALAPRAGGQAVLDINPTYLAQYYWNPATSQFDACPSTSTAEPFGSTPQAVVPAALNASLGQWTPATSCNGVGAGVISIQPGTGTNCTPLVDGVCTGNVTINVAPGAALTLQHNGANLADQALLNFDDTTPAAPNGFVNVAWQSNSGGELSGYVPIEPFAPVPVPPISGQYVVVYGTVPTLIQGGTGPACGGTGPTGEAYASAQSVLAVATTCGNGLSANTWGGSTTVFTLPAGLNPANITAVYAFSLNAFGPYVPGAVFPNTQCVGPQNTVTLYGSEAYPLTQFTGLLTVSGSWTAPDISGIVCSATVNYSVFGGAGTDVTLNEPSVGLYVYYTGSPVTQSPSIEIAPPLYYNSAVNILSVDTTFPFPTQDFRPLTVATLPSARAYTNNIVLVGDGTSSTDCTTGGGSTPVLCVSNGTAWSSFASGGGGGVTTFNTRSGAVVPTSGDYTVSQVTGAAPLASPALTGIPTAPTQSCASNTDIATGAYVAACAGGSGSSVSVNGGSTIASPNLDNTTPAAPTNGINVQFQQGSGGAVNDVSAAVVGDGNASHFLNGTGAFSAPSGGGTVSALCPSGSAPNSECIYTQNDSTGTVINESVCFDSDLSASTCPALATGSAQGTNNPPPFLGICVSNCSTTGWAIVQISGEVAWKGDGQATAPPTGGQVNTWVQPSPSTAGEFHAPETNTFYANENPESNSIVGFVTTTNTGAGTNSIITLTQTQGPYKGIQEWNNQPNTNASGAIVLATNNDGATSQTVSHLYQAPSNGPIIFGIESNGLLVNTGCPYCAGTGNNFVAFGNTQSSGSVGGNNVKLDGFTYQASGTSAPFEMDDYTFTDPDVRNVTGTITQGAYGGWEAWASTNIHIWTLTGNAAITDPVTFNNPGEVQTFELIQASTGGPYTFTWPAAFKNAPAMTTVAGGVTVAQFLFDGTNYNCISGCQSGGTVAITANSTALTCTTGTVSVAGAAPGMAAVASAAGTADPDVFVAQAYVSTAGTVTVQICTLTTDTSAPSITYNVRILQ